MGAGQPVADTPAAGTKQAFLSTPNGRIALIAGAVVIFLAVAAVVAAVVFNFIGGDPQIDDPLTPAPGSVVTTPAAPAATAVEPKMIPSSDIFTFRDIFDPVLKPRPAEEETPAVGAVGADGVAMDPDTLYLLNILVEDGVAKVLVEFNEAQHTLAEGEAISGTPWQVLSIGSDSAVMLYGDSRVTLSIGQGVTTDAGTPGAVTPVTK